MLFGELAALATSVCFSATSTLFTFAGRQVGSVVVNRTRLVLAVCFLIAAHLLLGTPLPVHVAGERWFWLGISGIIGLVLGDAFLFQAFIWIGPRLSMLMMALAPIIASLMAWLFLDEILSVMQILGILVTVAGIAWVVLEQNGQRKISKLETRNYLMGFWGFGVGCCASPVRTGTADRR